MSKSTCYHVFVAGDAWPKWRGTDSDTPSERECLAQDVSDIGLPDLPEVMESVGVPPDEAKNVQDDQLVKMPSTCGECKNEQDEESYTVEEVVAESSTGDFENRVSERVVSFYIGDAGSDKTLEDERDVQTVETLAERMAKIDMKYELFLQSRKMT